MNNKNEILDNVQYILNFYDSNLSDDDIDKVNEEENSIKSIEGTLNEKNKMVEFLVSNEGNIKDKVLKIMLTASVNNDEKVNYKISSNK